MHLLPISLEIHSTHRPLSAYSPPTLYVQPLNLAHHAFSHLLITLNPVNLNNNITLAALLIMSVSGIA